MEYRRNPKAKRVREYWRKKAQQELRSEHPRYFS